LPLPSSFLVDQYGRAAVLYRGPVTAAQVVADSKLLDDSDRAAASLVACLPGHSIQHPRVDEIDTATERQTRYRTAAWLEADGYLNDAVDHFSVLANANPSWGLPQQHLAKLYLDENQLNYAEAWGMAALRADPNDAQSNNTLGLIQSRQGKPAEAEGSFRLALKANPKFAGAYNNLGIVLAMQRKLNEAKACFQQAIKLDDVFAQAHTNLGNVFATQQDIDSAIKHYQRAIEIEPEHVDPYNNLGTMYGRQGSVTKAIECYERALKIDPQNAEAKRNLSRATEKLNLLK
jgi:tetratricopeptide (TPR) repeat protein